MTHGNFRTSIAARALPARLEPRAGGFAALMAGLATGTLAVLLLAIGTAAGATERAGERDSELDPPGRVGRIGDMQGNVSRYDAEGGRWRDAERNRPLTTGDRLSTAGGARVELRVGSTALRLGGGTELEVLRLDDDRLAFKLHGGSLALRVRTREKAAEIEVVTEEARLLPMRAGHYRIDRNNEATFAASWRGDLRVDDSARLTAATGQRLELFRDPRTNELRHVWRGLAEDAFSSWAQAEDRRDERVASSGHVSPEMTGAEDLDRWGTWDRHPDYGTVWYPREVRADWTPYRHGRWAWVSPWGWTWVDEAPWGFAPFHYGRWVHWGGRWCWAPGTYVQRPVYAPAMVAWVGGPNFSVSVNIGGPTVGWVPLAPREVYVPYYRVTPVYVERVNGHPHGYPPGQRPYPRTVPTGPVAYSNQGVPGAVTVVPRDVLVRREPVARAVVAMPEVHRAPVTVAPPAPVMSAAPAPVGRVGPPREGVGDDGRGGSRGPDRREFPALPAQRVEPPPRAEPGAAAPRQDGGVPTPGVVATPGRRGEARDGLDARDGRDGRDGRDPRAGRDAREGTDRRGGVGDASSAGDQRQVAPPVQQVAPAQPAPAQPAPVQPARPAVQPPRQGSAPVVAVPQAPAVQPAPAQRAPRGERGNDDDRKRSGQQPRQGEREREASR